MGERSSCVVTWMNCVCRASTCSSSAACRAASERDGAEIGHGAQPGDCGGIDGKRTRCVEMQGAERPLSRTQAQAQGRAGGGRGAGGFYGGEAFRKRLLIERAFGEGNG